MMKTSFMGAVAAIMLSFALNGCSSATTSVVSEWRNPAHASGSFKRIMVGGPEGETSVRRNVEDEFSARLRATGTEALTSYQYLPENEKINLDNLKEAARKAGADAVLFSQPVHAEAKTKVEPRYGPSTSFGIFGSHGGVSWSGLSGGPTVSRYTEYTTETSLLDLTKDEVVWTGTVKTRESESIRTTIKSYVDAVMKALDEQNLVRKGQ